MPANDELPRGVHQSFVNGSGLAAVQFGAVPGISWVITDLAAKIATTAAPVITVANMQVDDSISGGVPFISLMVLGIPVANQWVSDEVTWSGKIVGNPGAALTVLIGLYSGTGVASYWSSVAAFAYPL